MARRTIHSAVLGLAALAALLVPAAGARLAGNTEAPAPQAAQASSVVAIRNATLITVSRGTINNGTIVMRDGKIAAIGTNVQIPAGATLVDGTGKFVTPGLIDAHSHIGNDAINEGATRPLSHWRRWACPWWRRRKHWAKCVSWTKEPS